MLLREGVEVIKASVESGTPFLINDHTQKRQYRIPKSWGLILSNSVSYKKFDDSILDKMAAFLKANNLLRGMPPKDQPEQPFINKIMFTRVNLLRPDAFLEAHKGLCSLPFTKGAYILWAMMWVVAVFLVYGQLNSLLTYTGQYLSAPFYVIVALILVKIIHEFGHACAAKRAGGYVKGIGVVLICLAPLPMTETAMLAGASKKDKILCALAGIYFESWAALICLILWAGWPEGPVRVALHFVAVVSLMITIAGNMIPIMKFDGYHLISSILVYPRMYEDALIAFKKAAYSLIGYDYHTDIAEDRALRRSVLVAYGATLMFWRTIALPVGIVYSIMHIFGEMRISYLALLLPITTFWILPALREIRTVKIMKKQPNYKFRQFIALSIIGLIAAYLLIPHKQLVTMPVAIMKTNIPVVTQSDGTITYIHESGPVKKGDILLKYRDEQLQVLNEESKNIASKLRTEFRQVKPEISSSVIDNDWQRLALRKKEEKHRSGLQVIRATQSGWFECDGDVGVARNGLVVGNVYPDGSKTGVKIFFNNKTPAPEQIKGVVITNYGERIPVNAEKTSLNIKTSLFPSWVTDIIGDDRQTIYSSDIEGYKELPEGMAGFETFVTYSLANRFWITLKARQNMI